MHTRTTPSPSRIVSMAVNVGILALAFLFLTQRPAHAYLDPGTGSMVFQVLAGAALASLFAVKMFWLRIRTFVAATVLRRRPDADAVDPD